MKVTEGVWVVKVSREYNFGQVLGKYADYEEAHLKSGLEENDSVLYLHEGEVYCGIDTWFGL